jgi:hypothetical protein
MPSKLVSSIEIFIGVVGLLLAAWMHFTSILKCEPAMIDCGNWSSLGWALFGTTGISLLVAGIVLYIKKSWLSQIILIPAAIFILFISLYG